MNPTFKSALVLAAIVFLASALSLARFTPRVFFWQDYSAPSFETARVPSLLAQLDNPGGWDRLYWTNPLFGDNTLRWRLLPPVIGHALHLAPRVYFALPWLALLLLIGACLHYLQRAGVSAPALFASGVLIATSAAFFGSAAWVGCFDSFYLLALITFCFTPSPLLAAAACALGPWCDEKFLLMLPVCFCMRWSWQPSNRWVWWSVAAVFPYCLARFGAVAAGDSSLSRQLAMQSPAFADYCGSLPLAWAYAFRLGWMPLAVGIAAVWRKLQWKVGALFMAALFAEVALVAFLAWDTTRNIADLLPFLVLGLRELRLRSWTLAALAAGNLALPAAYVCCAHPVTVPLTSWLTR
jgi:hypothetical protein